MNRPYVSFRYDVASWLADRLTEREWDVDEELEQDAEGWGFAFGQGRDEFWLSVTCLNPEEARWLVSVRWQLGFFGRMMGAGNRDLPDTVLLAMHDCLTADPLVNQILWHSREEFNRGNLEEGAQTPC
jgi:hypothetical protein